MTEENEDITIIKKYANRRLYNTRTSCYITLEDVHDLIRHKENFIVLDAKTGKDLTRSVLTQIILEAEMTDAALLPTSFLLSIIHFYDSGASDLLPPYLESSMQQFADNQENLRRAMEQAAGSIRSMSPFGSLEEMTRRNLDLFKQGMDMFRPFGFPAGGETEEKEKK